MEIAQFTSEIREAAAEHDRECAKHARPRLPPQFPKYVYKDYDFYDIKTQDDVRSHFSRLDDKSIAEIAEKAPDRRVTIHNIKDKKAWSIPAGVRFTVRKYDDLEWCSGQYVQALIREAFVGESAYLPWNVRGVVIGRKRGQAPLGMWNPRTRNIWLHASPIDFYDKTRMPDEYVHASAGNTILHEMAHAELDGSPHSCKSVWLTSAYLEPIYPDGPYVKMEPPSKRYCDIINRLPDGLRKIHFGMHGITYGRVRALFPKYSHMLLPKYRHDYDEWGRAHEQYAHMMEFARGTRLLSHTPDVKAYMVLREFFKLAGF